MVPELSNTQFRKRSRSGRSVGRSNLITVVEWRTQELVAAVVGFWLTGHTVVVLVSQCVSVCITMSLPPRQSAKLKEPSFTFS